MKTIRKGLLTLLLCVFALAMGVFAVACGGKKATVSFDTDGGSTVASMTVVPGEDFRLPVPERDGFVFEGWYDNEGRTGTVYTSTANVEKDTTFYAKWLRGYTLKLDLDEGEYNGESEISFLVGAGQKLLEARYEGSPLSDVQPYKDGVEFGAWFDENDAEVTDSYVMPSRDVTIKAKYVVYYTIEIHTQTEPHGEEYEVDEDTGYVNGQGYVNELLAVTAPTVEHYEYDAKHAGTVSSLTLTTDTKSNMFVLYYNRATYRVIYNSNAPQNTEVTGEMHDTTYVYGEEGTIARCKFQIEGHRLAGWATSASGTVAYKSGDTFEEGNYNLFAIWDAGYRDLLGGSDYIYFPRTMNGGVILFRAEHEFEGKRKSLDGEGNYVDDASGNYVDFGNGLIAKLDSKNMTFVFYYKDRVGEYEYYAPYEDSTEKDVLDTKITLQGFELGTIVENGETKNFSYYFDDEKNSFMMQVEGEKTARPFVFGIQDEKLVFTFRGEEMGEYLLYQRTSVVGYTVGVYSYLYDGVGGVSLCDAETGDPIMTGIYYKPTEIGEGDLTTYLCVSALIDGDRHDVMLTSFSSGTDTIPGAILKDTTAVGDFTRTTGEKTEKLTLSGYSGYNGAVIYEDAEGNKNTYDCFTEETVLGTVLHVLSGDPTTTQTEEHTFLLTATYKYDGTIEKGEFKDYEKFTQYIYLYTPDGATNTYSNQTLVIFDGEMVDFKEDLQRIVTNKDENGNDVYEYETYTVDMKGYRAAIYTTDGSFPGYVTEKEYASMYSSWNMDPNPLYHFEADVDVDSLPDNKEKEVFNEQHIYKNFYTTFEFQTLELNIGDAFYVYKSLDVYNSSGFNYGVYGTEVKEGEQGVAQQRVLMTIYPVLATTRGTGFEGYTAYYWASEDAEPIQGSLESHSLDSNAAAHEFITSSKFFTFYYYEGTSTELKELHFAYHDENMLNAYIEFFDYVPKTMARTLTVTRRVGAISLSESYISMIMAEDGKTAYYFTSAANYVAGQAIQGTYSEVSRTQLNGIKYLFTPDNLEECDPFEFIYEERIGSDNISYVDVVRYCDERWRDYSATLEDGSTVTLDGYGHYARYTTYTGIVFEGNYIFFTDADDKFTQFAIYTPTGRSITLQATIATDEEGNFLSLKLEERADYYLLFASDYWFPAGFDQAIVVFNSKDNTFIMPEYGAWVWYKDWEQGIINDPSWDPGEYKNLMKATGTYELVDEDDLLFVLHCNLMKDGKETGAKRDMLVKMMFGGNDAILLLQDDNIVGSYVGPNNEVVYIDGYGQSFFVDDHGNRREGIYTYISDNPNNSNYQYVAFDDGEVCYVMVFDQENGTFTIGNKEEDYQTFYSDNFDSVEYTQVFSVNGDAIGYWFFDSSSGGEFKLYEANFNEETSFTYSLSTDYTYPDKNAPSITMDGTEYFRFEKDTAYSLGGSLVFDAFLERNDLKADTSAKWGNMKLDFVPDGTNELNAPATFTFTKDGKEEIYGNLTIRKEVVNVLQGKTATIIKLYQKNNPYGFRLELDRNPESGKDGFTLHAAATEAEFPDYSVEMLGGVGYYQMTYGTKYSIGVKEWDISEWGFDPDEWIVSIVFNAADKNNKILSVDVLYSEYFQLAKEGSDKKGGHIITEDTTGYIASSSTLNVWEVPFVASDGYTYSAWIEVLDAGYMNGRPIIFSALYALNIKQTFETTIGKTTDEGVEDVTGGEKVTVTTQQFECAYWGLLTYGSVYTIGIENTETKESLIDEQSLGNWVDDLIILYWNDADDSEAHKGLNYPAAEQKDAYVVKVTRDTNDVITGARIDKSDYRIVKSSNLVKCEEYTDENGDKQPAKDTLDHEDWYFGFVKGYGTESGKTQAKIKDYLCYAAKFNVQTGEYEKVTFYGQVNMTAEGTYVLRYTLGEDETVWRVTILFEKDDDGNVITDKDGNPVVSVSKPA